MLVQIENATRTQYVRVFIKQKIKKKKKETTLSEFDTSTICTLYDNDDHHTKQIKRVPILVYVSIIFFFHNVMKWWSIFDSHSRGCGVQYIYGLFFLLCIWCIYSVYSLFWVAL